MHDEMRVGQLAVDFLDDAHGEDVAVRLAGELVSAVGGAAGDRQRVDLGAGDEIDGLVGVGQQLVVRQRALGAMAVFGLAVTALQRAQHAELAFDRGADPVRHARDTFGDSDIVVVACRRLGVGLQRAVHHHRGEAVADGGQAGRFVVAVILVHADRDVRIDLGQRVDHLRQHHVVGVGAGAARRLDDDRRVTGLGRLHDGEALLHVVDVECRHAVTVFGGVIEQLAKGDAGHSFVL